MGDDDHLKNPETIKEVGIHIGYMRRDFNSLKDFLEASDYVKQADFTAYKDIAAEARRVIYQEVNDLSNWKDKLIGKIAGAGIIMLVLMVLAFYGLDRFFSL